MSNISVLILTLNEEVNLPGCLESVSWSDDIVVFDSYSTDRTEEIAKDYGARVVQREFDNYAAQRNAALNEVQYKNDWVLMVDADERWQIDIFNKIDRCLQSDKNDNISIYHFQRKDMFCGKWLKHSLASTTWSGRLVRVGNVSVQREINEEYHTNGKKAYISGVRFVHYPFNKGINWWFERHNRYSSMEAVSLLYEIENKLHFRKLLTKDPTLRRKYLKQLAYRIPFRPLIVFIYLYFIRLGFLDGWAGFTYCRLRSIYEYMIDLKVKELRRREKGLPI